MEKNPASPPRDFIRQKVALDVAAKKNGAKVHTRFPPEPNGYLHIGHAKAICLNFGIAAEHAGGLCNLRFDDTNPENENPEYVEAIREDIHWLGYDWGNREYFASDRYEELHQLALTLIRKGKAYVDSLSPDEIRAYRGSLTKPGRNSPYRERSVEENLDLFQRMKAGEFPDGSHVLRAKIDMAAKNLNLRDPTIYRIRKVSHHRTGDAWCIYPMYDFAHGQCDALEGITHSLCTLEFENHRPLYDWFLDQLDLPCRPQQIEFARLNLNYTVMSKRKLKKLVDEGRVSGWDDPRMPTLCGLRRRGYTKEAIRNFCARIGVAKYRSVVDVALLEHCLRDHLNRTSPRVLAVLNPLKLVITNYPADKSEELLAINNPEDPLAGSRSLPFSRELWIEREDFMEEAPRRFHRLAPGREVRLRYAYLVTCTGFKKDPQSGAITEVHGTYDPATRGGSAPDGRKVKGTLHWVSARHAITAQVRLYDRLFKVPDPESGEDFKEHLNPASLRVLDNCKLEPGLGEAAPGTRFQFERQGYFVVDSKDSSPGAPIFNRTVPLRDSWARLTRKS